MTFLRSCFTIKQEHLQQRRLLMKPTLTFEKMAILCGEAGSASSLPDLGGMKILQNQLTFHLGEAEEIYEGYGTLPSAYPYRQYNTYSRTLKSTDVHTAFLVDRLLKRITSFV